MVHYGIILIIEVPCVAAGGVIISSPMLKTKLLMPDLPNRLIERKLPAGKLSHAISNNHKLSIVSAPAGYGKTTLAAQWIKYAGHPFAWLTLDSGDNDPVRFIKYFIAALQRIDSSIGEGIISTLNALMPLSLEFADILTNELLQLKVKSILVLDDYHLISSHFIHEFLSYIIENKPGNLHTIIISREDLPFSVSRLRAGARLTEIREKELQFSTEEALEYYRHCFDLEISEQQISKLQLKTEGWAAGMHLAGISLESKNTEEAGCFIDRFGGTQRYIMDYLSEEVLSELSPELRKFLCFTSVLDVFNEKLCEAVTGSENCAMLLQRIIEKRLFLIQLDENGEWFRYHKLFADILTGELNNNYLINIYTKAALWFDENGYPDEAIRYALASGDSNVMGPVITRNWVGTVLRGQHQTVLECLKLLNDTCIKENASLSICKAWCLFVTGEGDKALELIDHIIEGEVEALNAVNRGILLLLVNYMSLAGYTIKTKMLAEPSNPDPDGGALLDAVIQLGKAQSEILQGDFNKAENAFRRVLKSGMEAGLPVLVIAALKNYAIRLLLSGRRGAAVDACMEIINNLRDRNGKYLPIAELIFVPLGLAYYFSNELEKAEEYFKIGISRYSKMNFKLVLIQAKIYSAIADCSMGHYEEACSSVRSGMTEAEFYRLESQLLIFRALSAYINLKTGNTAGAYQWADTFLQDIAMDDTLSHAPAFIILVRILIHRGNVKKAHEILSHMESELNMDRNFCSAISIFVLLAIVEKHCGNIENALNYFKKAVGLAEMDNYIRCILDEGSEIIDLIRTLGKDYSRCAGRLVEALEVEYPEILEDPIDKVGEISYSIIENLSKREQEVLKLVCAGLSNDEISKKLFISVGTTKWHLGNIFLKLGVKRRTQAVEMARKLKLI